MRESNETQTDSSQNVPTSRGLVGQVGRPVLIVLLLAGCVTHKKPVALPPLPSDTNALHRVYPRSLKPMRFAETPQPTVPFVQLPGFRITNVVVGPAFVSLAWQEGIAPFQLQCSTNLKTWSNIGNVTFARTESVSKTGTNGNYRLFDSAQFLAFTLPNTFTITEPGIAMPDSPLTMTLQRSPDKVAITPIKTWNAPFPNPMTQNDTPPDGTDWYRAVEVTANGLTNAGPWLLVSNDVTPPSYVHIDSPSNGAMLTGTVSVTVTVRDAVAVGPIQIVISVPGSSENILLGTIQGSGTDFTGSINIDTTVLLNRSDWNLGCKGFDAAGNSRWASSIGVTISNPTPYVGDPKWLIDAAISDASASGKAQVLSAACDPSGNIFICGFFQFKANLGTGNLTSTYQNAFLAKYNNSHVLQWVNHFGSSLDNQAFGIAIDSGGAIYITGKFTKTVDFGGIVNAGAGHSLTSGNTSASDVFVAKYATANGACAWAISFPSSYGGNNGQAIAVDPSGALIVSGFTSQNINFNDGNGEITAYAAAFVAKLAASNGATSWAKHFSGGVGNSVYPAGVATASNGDVITGGNTRGGVDLGDGHVVIAGGGDADMWMVKLDHTDGHTIWGRVIGGSGTEVAYDFAVVQSSGAIIACGSAFGSTDWGNGWTTSAPNCPGVIVAQFNSAGVTQRVQLFGGTDPSLNSSAVARNVRLDPDGNIVIAGLKAGEFKWGDGLPHTFGRSLFSAKFTTSGILKWYNEFGQTGGIPSANFGLAIDSSGNNHAVGYFTGTFTVGPYQISSANSSTQDGFMYRVGN